MIDLANVNNWAKRSIRKGYAGLNIRYPKIYMKYIKPTK